MQMEHQLKEKNENQDTYELNYQEIGNSKK